jgi:hypothetical protein
VPESAPAPERGFVKLPAAAFGRLTTSDIWTGAPEVKLIWLTLLTCADSKGHGTQGMRELAELSGVPYSDACRAVEHLVAKGRVQTFDGGRWLIVDAHRYQVDRPSPAAS